MMACCSLCYIKYLNPDGSLDLQALNDGIEKYKILAEQRKIDDKRIVEHNGYCRCNCHRKDMKVLH